MGLLDWLNPATWRADRRGVRELALMERQASAQRDSVISARYKNKPRAAQSSISTVSGPIENPQIKTTPLSPKVVRHRFLIKTGGPAPAQEVSVWLAWGDEYEVRRTDEVRVGLLRATDDEYEVELVEVGFDGGGVPRDGALRCRWTDGNGTHVKSLLNVTLHI
jgi:hypothetical protein